MCWVWLRWVFGGPPAILSYSYLVYQLVMLRCIFVRPNLARPKLNILTESCFSQEYIFIRQSCCTQASKKYSSTTTQEWEDRSQGNNIAHYSLGKNNLCMLAISNIHERIEIYMYCIYINVIILALFIDQYWIMTSTVRVYICRLRILLSTFLCQYIFRSIECETRCTGTASTESLRESQKRKKTMIIMWCAAESDSQILYRVGALNWLLAYFPDHRDTDFQRVQIFNDC